MWENELLSMTRSEGETIARGGFKAVMEDKTAVVISSINQRCHGKAAELLTSEFLGFCSKYPPTCRRQHCDTSFLWGNWSTVYKCLCTVPGSTLGTLETQSSRTSGALLYNSGVDYYSKFIREAGFHPVITKSSSVTGWFRCNLNSIIIYYFGSRCRNWLWGGRSKKVGGACAYDSLRVWLVSRLFDLKADNFVVLEISPYSVRCGHWRCCCNIFSATAAFNTEVVARRFGLNLDIQRNKHDQHEGTFWLLTVSYHPRDNLW